MSSQLNIYYTPEQFLEFESKASYKSEYFNGQIIAMAGASPDHVLIVTNISTQLNNQLDQRPCRVFATDLLVQATVRGIYYPDIAVVCGELQLAKTRTNQTAVTNPLIIIEVLSASTETIDRGEKLINYTQIASLSEYVLIAQDQVYAEQWIQSEGIWKSSHSQGLDSVIQLPSIGCTLPMSRIYHKVEFRNRLSL
jgi:Uma2 family endonuclease